MLRSGTSYRRGSKRARVVNQSTPTVVEVMDSGSGPDVQMSTSTGTGPSTRIPARFYKKSAYQKYLARRRANYRNNNNQGLRVYRPLNLVAGRIGGIRGRGDYFTDGLTAVAKAAKRMVPAGAFSRLGRAFGGAVGGAPGAEFGGVAGKLIGSIAGFGDYTIKYNSLLDMGHPIPSFGDMSQATVVRHREYITDIVVPATPGTFTNRTFILNPGNPQTFPWLSQIAACYDQYQFMGCVFGFKSTAGDTATFALGSVIMASDYDVSDPPYTSKNQMEQSQYCVSSKATVDQIHPIECDPSVGPVAIKYIDHADSVISSFEKRLADHALVQIATTGLPGGTSGSIGELWVSYEVALYKPAVPTSPGAAVVGGVASKFAIGNSFSIADPLGNPAISPVIRAGSNLNIGLDHFLGNNCLVLPVGFPVGNYHLTSWWVATNTLVVDQIQWDILDMSSGLASPLITFLPYMGNTGNLLALQPGVSSIVYYAHRSFRVNATLTNELALFVASGTIPTAAAGSFCDVMVVKCPDLLLN